MEAIMGQQNTTNGFHSLVMFHLFQQNAVAQASAYAREICIATSAILDGEWLGYAFKSF